MRKIETHIENKRMFDIVIEEFNKQLKDKVSWIDQAIGRAFLLEHMENGKSNIEPVIYTHGNAYDSLMPSADLGNYTYILLPDPTIKVSESNGIYQSDLHFMVWADMRKVTGMDGERCVDLLKEEIFTTVNDEIYLKSGNIMLSKCYEEEKNVFKGITTGKYSHIAISHPYVALRFDGYIIYRKQCDE